MKHSNKGFTLIELVAVLVIMAIIALIVTPLVMNIIRKAQRSANERSVDAYGRSAEIAVLGYMLDHGDVPTSFADLQIEYSGGGEAGVVCNTQQINYDGSVYVADCSVNGVAVDGYVYGKLGTASVGF